MKWKQWIFGMALSLLLPATAFAGDINAAEQSVLAVACGTFEYKGVTYQATPGHMAQARAKMMQDDVDLTPAQAQEAIASIYANVQTGIAEGYIVPISGSGNAEDSASGESSEESNGEESFVTENGGLAEDIEPVVEEVVKTPEEIHWEEVELPALTEQRQEMNLITENRIQNLESVAESETEISGNGSELETQISEDASESDSLILESTEKPEAEPMVESSKLEPVIKDTGYTLSGIWIIPIIFLIGIGICTMCMIKYQLLAHNHES